MDSESDFNRESSLWACLALRHAYGIGPKKAKDLLAQYGSSDQALQKAGQWAEDGIIPIEIVEHFRRGLWQDEARRELSAARSCAQHIITWDDPHYPELLRQIFAPPLILYAIGDITLLNNPALAVVGARKATAESLQLTAELAEALSKSGLTVISGLAAGVDAQAHESALKGAGSSIAVMPTGIDCLYPKKNHSLWQRLKKDGLILSEFPPGTQAFPSHFPQRNRIISGLSLGTILTQASDRSGGLITARMAMESGREVFAVPGPPKDDRFAGCNNLIRHGAYLTQSIQDILEVLAPRLKEYAIPAANLQPATQIKETTEADPGRINNSADPALPPEQSFLLELLKKQGLTHIDAITREMGISPQKASSLLLILEMKGMIEQKSGMMYTLS